MKIRFICILFAAALSFAQFSSGTDYSVKKDQISDQAGAVFHFEKNDTEWSVNYDTGKNFTARSEIFGYGYGLYGQNNIDNIALHYTADHIIRKITGSVTIDTTSTEDQTINTDLEDITLQDIRSEAGICFNKKFGVFAGLRYFSIDERNKNTVQYGIRGEYSHDYTSGKNLLLRCGFSSAGDEDIISGLSMISEISPVTEFGAVFTVPFENSKLGLILNFFSFDGSQTKDKDENYINAGLSYKYFISKAQSSINASAGTNLTSGMEVPEIHLPYFYNNIEFSNKMLKGKMELTVGWKYELYEAVLADRADIISLTPDEIISSDDIRETAAINKLYIKLGFLY